MHCKQTIGGLQSPTRPRLDIYQVCCTQSHLRVDINLLGHTYRHLTALESTHLANQHEVLGPRPYGFEAPD
jgi:hypothetical protein